MTNTLTIDTAELLHQLKLSCQIPTLVEAILHRRVIATTAAELGIQVEPEELQQAADQMRLMSGLHTAEITHQWLQANNLSMDDFEALIQTNLLSDKLAQHLFADKVEAFFVEHQLDYAQAVLYEVVLPDADLAMELFYAIQEGEISFHEVAHQYIQEPEQRRLGGYRGVLKRTDLSPEMTATVFAAQPPQVLKPIVTAQGAHLILVEELLQPQLEESLRQEILSDLFATWLQQQIAPMEARVARDRTTDDLQL